MVAPLSPGGPLPLSVPAAHSLLSNYRAFGHHGSHSRIYSTTEAEGVASEEAKFWPNIEDHHRRSSISDTEAGSQGSTRY